MIKRSVFKFISLFYFLLSLSANGVSQVAYHNFNSNDGLPSNEVYCVHQDRDGFLWFGTDHGVVKYNGYNFKTFTTDDGLTDNTILSMKEDDIGNLWFLTLTGGICYFDGNKFAAHPMNDSIRQLCRKGIPTSYEILSNKQVWLGLVDHGVARFDTDKSEFFNMVGAAMMSDTLHNYVWHLTKDRYIYFSFKNHKTVSVNVPGVNSVDDYSFKTKFLPGGAIDISLFFLPGNGMIMSRASHLIYTDSRGYIHEYALSQKNNIANLQETKDQRTWMLLQNGPSYSLELHDSTVSLTDSFTFVHNASDISVDKQGNYWLTTVDHGIYMLPNRKVHVYNYSAFAELPKLSCLNSNSKYLYVGLPEGRLLRIDKQLKPVTYESKGWNSVAISSITFNLNDEPQTNIDTAFLNRYPKLYVVRLKWTKGLQI